MSAWVQSYQNGRKKYRVYSNDKQKLSAGRSSLPPKHHTLGNAIAGIDLLFLGQSNSKTDPKRNGQHNEEDYQSAPPLELAAVAGVFVGVINLLDTLFEVLVCVLSVGLGGLDDWILLLNHSREFLVEDSKLSKGLLDALELAVAGSDVA